MQNTNVGTIKRFVNTYSDGEVFEYCKEEFFSIVEKPNLRGNRTIRQVFEHCKQGTVAEMFLIDNYGYIRNPKKYHDIISSTGVETEIKAFTVCTPEIIRKTIEKAKVYSDAKIYIFFLYSNSVYTLYSIEKLN